MSETPIAPSSPNGTRPTTLTKRLARYRVSSGSWLVRSVIRVERALGADERRGVGAGDRALVATDDEPDAVAVASRVDERAFFLEHRSAPAVRPDAVGYRDMKLAW